MKKYLWMLTLLAATQTHAMEIADIKLEDKIQLDQHQVILSGAGIRTKFFVKVYVAALYLGARAATAEAVLADSGAKRMSFILLREVSGKQVLNGINEAILPNNSIEEMQALETRLHEFEQMFVNVPVIRAGEIVNLDYIPGSGTRVTVNGVFKGMIAGEDFSRTLLKIWVGKKPVQAALKKKILGEM